MTEKNYRNQQFIENCLTERARSGGRNVLITGGSIGFGPALVKTFVEAGDQVYFTLGRNSVAALHHERGNVESLNELFVEVLILNSRYGPKTIDDVIRASRERPAQSRMPGDAVDPLLLVQTVLPRMKENDSGKIIFISSLYEQTTQLPSFPYPDGMSKAGMVFLVKHLGAELVEDRVDIFGVCPGATDRSVEYAQLCYLLCSTKAARLLRGSVLTRL